MLTCLFCCSSSWSGRRSVSVDCVYSAVTLPGLGGGQLVLTVSILL